MQSDTLHWYTFGFNCRDWCLMEYWRIKKFFSLQDAYAAVGGLHDKCYNYLISNASHFVHSQGWKQLPEDLQKQIRKGKNDFSLVLSLSIQRHFILKVVLNIILKVVLNFILKVILKVILNIIVKVILNIIVKVILNIIWRSVWSSCWISFWRSYWNQSESHPEGHSESHPVGHSESRCGGHSEEFFLIVLIFTYKKFLCLVERW